MLVQPRHPDSVPSRSSYSSTRPGIPLARSSSTTAAAAAAHMASARQPLGAIQPIVPARSGSGALAAQQHQEVQKLQQQTRRSTSPPEHPQAAATAPAPAQAQKDKEKEKARSKLSEQWADPPKQVRREDVWLDRRHLLGEVSGLSFSRSLPVRADDRPRSVGRVCARLPLH